MRVAVISDIHGNLHALEAVLAAVDAEGVDEVWCLGDVVGYGPRPNECCDLVQERATIALCGNHDLAVIGAIDITEFTGDAAAAALWTRTVLGAKQREWLASLAPVARRDPAQLFHASPRNPVWEYVLSEHVARLSLEATDAPLVLVGHSHVALAIGLHDGTTEGGLAPAGTTTPLAERRWLLNPGSVGQPRDGDARACWLLVDTGDDLGTFRRAEYPVAQTQEEMHDANLPETLASRLAHGV